MTLFRLIVLLCGLLLLLLTVVVLRTETTRLHYEISRLEQETAELRGKTRAAELELARCQNPLLMRERVERAAQQYAQERADGD